MTNEKRFLNSSELATYIVCPEAWRLKLQGEGSAKISKRAQEVKEKRKEWIKTQETSSLLKHYLKVLYTLMLLIVLTLFMIEIKNSEKTDHKNHSTPTVRE